MLVVCGDSLEGNMYESHPVIVPELVTESCSRDDNTFSQSESQARNRFAEAIVRWEAELVKKRNL